MTVASRIEGRKEATELLQTLAHLTEGDADYLDGIKRACLEFAGDLVPKPQTLRTMTKEQAAAFGKTRINFGIHYGATYDVLFDQHQDYLEWLADAALDLQAFLRFKNG